MAMTEAAMMRRRQLTGTALGPEVQIEVQALHHVRQLVVVRILPELNTDEDTL